MARIVLALVAAALLMTPLAAAQVSLDLGSGGQRGDCLSLSTGGVSFTARNCLPSDACLASVESTCLLSLAP